MTWGQVRTLREKKQAKYWPQILTEPRREEREAQTAGTFTLGSVSQWEAKLRKHKYLCSRHLFTNLSVTRKKEEIKRYLIKSSFNHDTYTWPKKQHKAWLEMGGIYMKGQILMRTGERLRNTVYCPLYLKAPVPHLQVLNQCLSFPLNIWN